VEQGAKLFHQLRKYLLEDLQGKDVDPEDLGKV
jgi:hypothetical protein